MPDGYFGEAVMVEIRHRFGPRMMEWFSGAVTLTFGIVVLISHDLFQQPSYRVFAAVFNQSVFGWIMVAAGFMRIMALIINGARKHVTPVLRQVAAFFGLAVWGGITFGFWGSGVIGTWAAIYPWLVIAELTNIHRAANDQGETRNGRSNPAPSA